MDIIVLAYVLLIIALAKTLGEVVSRFNQPPIVGELLAGIVLGPFLLGQIFSELNPMYEDEFIKGLADLGILLFMLYIGMEFSPKRLMRFAWFGILTAICAIAFALLLGFAAGILFGLSGVALIFLAIAMAITALPVTMRILKDMEVIDTEIGGRIISAAMISDVSLLFAMALVIGRGENGATESNELMFLALGIAIFFAMVFLFGKLIVPRLYTLLRWMQTGEAAFAIAIGLAIAFAVVATLVGLPDFIGAFLAGLILRETGTGLKVWKRVEDILSAITLGFLLPIFFVLIGFSVNFEEVFGRDIATILLFFVVLAFAVIGKSLGAYVPARLSHMSKEEGMAIGSMMVANGALGLVLAQLALEMGVIEDPLFSIIVLMSFISTALSPILFRRYFNAAARAGRKSCLRMKPSIETEEMYDQLTDI